MARSCSRLILSFVILAVFGIWADGRCWAQNLWVAGGERLLIVAPHPDDETLACGGLIQRVKALGGTVHVVYLTAGDGCLTMNPMTLVSAHAIHKRIGLRRMREAVDAMGQLNLERSNLIFLGYPDRGLMPLWQVQYEPRREYRSRLTGADHVFYPGVNSWGMPYDRESLIRSLTEVYDACKPTMVAMPSAEDAHSDHRASHYFMMAVIHRAGTKPRIMNYLIHYPANTDKGRGELPKASARKITLSLVKDEAERKKDALRAYHSQFPSLNRLMAEFARDDETFFEEGPEIPISFRSAIPAAPEFGDGREEVGS